MIIANGYLRADGRKGIRNVLRFVYLVECAHHVARQAVERAQDERVHLLGFRLLSQRVCARDAEVIDYSPQRRRSGPHFPRMRGVRREGLAAAVAASGRPVETVVIQEAGGTRGSIDAALAAIARVRAVMEQQERRAPVHISDLTIGTGGSDGTSGIAANPAVGRAFDRLVDAGAVCIFEETGEIGCEAPMSIRAASPEVAAAIMTSISNAESYYRAMGFGSFAPGNAEGGLSTQEEKSAGAYVKSGSRPIKGVIRPTQLPETPGLYLLDIVPETPPKFGFPNISDNAEIAELMSCGAHITLFTTGRGWVVGSAISPVIKITGNPVTYKRMAEDMDVNAGRALEGTATLDEVGEEIFRLTLEVAAGAATKSEALGHREFILTYKSADTLGTLCGMPAR